MSSSYDKVRGGKLSFKGLGPEKTLDKKRKKKKQKLKESSDPAEEVSSIEQPAKEEKEKESQAYAAIDTGTGHAPDGKKSKKYEELFPVETRRFGYVIPQAKSREAALDERVKKKADRYCK